MPNHGGSLGTAQESEIELVERLFRALNHLIRGDLSVIQNEISYVVSRHGDHDLRGAVDRCESISAKLSMLSSACAPRGCQEVFLEDIFGALGHSAPQSLGHLVGDPSAVRLILSFLPRALRAQPRSISCERSDTTFRFGIAFACAGTCLQAAAAFPSLSSFASAELGETAVVEAVVADLLMRACGWHASIRAAEGLIEASFVGPVVYCEAQERKA
jgi:hypothetical protein